MRGSLNPHILTVDMAGIIQNDACTAATSPGRPGGFTVIELVIVTVIIGLIIGLVVKGQSLIVTGQMKQLFHQKDQIAAAFQSYYESFAYYAGDDPVASSRFHGATDGNGNGRVGIGSGATPPDFACAGTGTEQCDLWFELRQANVLNGAGFANPKHVFSGNVALTYNTPGKGDAGHWLAFENLPPDVCRGLDRKYDDGTWNTGSIRGALDYDTAVSGKFILFFRL